MQRGTPGQDRGAADASSVEGALQLSTATAVAEDLTEQLDALPAAAKAKLRLLKLKMEGRLTLEEVAAIFEARPELGAA